jgi:integrase
VKPLFRSVYVLLISTPRAYFLLMQGTTPSRERLTKRAVDAAQPAALESFVWDADVPGFGLRVTRAGVKSFVYQYRVRGEKNSRRYTIGRYGAWTVDQARDRCRELVQLVARGEHPREVAKSAAVDRQRAKITAEEREFGAVADRWIESYKTYKGKPRRASSVRAAQGAVTRLKGGFAGQNIAEIDRAALTRFLDGIPGRMLATRASVFAYARALWRWAGDRALIESNPFDGFKAPEKPDARDRALADEELALIWRATYRLEYPFGPIYRLLMLLGQRREEVGGMDWSELDKLTATWTIPAARTKGKREHIVPLPAAAAAELQALASKDKWPRSGLVFTVTGETSVSGWSKAKARLEAEATKLNEDAPMAGWRTHDLRRTMVTGFQRLSIPESVAKAVINHAMPKSDALSSYARHSYSDEKRAALDAWAAHIAALIKPKLAAGEAAQGGSPP